MFGGDSISAGEKCPPTWNSLFDFWGGDLWPQTCVQNSGKIEKLRELLRVDWIPGEDSWVHEQIKTKAVFTRDPIECESAIEARDTILARFSPTTLSGRYSSNPPKRGPFGEAEIWVKMVPPLLAAQRFAWGVSDKKHTPLSFGRVLRKERWNQV